jgi:hypothetical protein
LKALRNGKKGGIDERRAEGRSNLAHERKTAAAKTPISAPVVLQDDKRLERR